MLLTLFIAGCSLLSLGAAVHLVRVAKADVRRMDLVNDKLNNLEVKR